MKKMKAPKDPPRRIAYFNGAPVYVLGTTTRADEGVVGHDVRCRPVRLGTGPYTFVTSPDALTEK